MPSRSRAPARSMDRRAARRSRSRTPPSTSRRRARVAWSRYSASTRVETVLEGGTIQERGQQPPAQRARSGRGPGLVEHLEQREAPAAVLQIGEQLEVALRRLVETHEGALSIDGERAEVIERAARVLPEVVEQHARGEDFDRVIGEPEALQVGHLELPDQPIARGGQVEAPVGQPVHQHAAAVVEETAHILEVGEQALRHDDLARIEPVQLPGQALGAGCRPGRTWLPAPRWTGPRRRAPRGRRRVPRRRDSCSPRARGGSRRARCPG